MCVSTGVSKKEKAGYKRNTGKKKKNCPHSILIKYSETIITEFWAKTV